MAAAEHTSDARKNPENTRAIARETSGLPSRQSWTERVSATEQGIGGGELCSEMHAGKTSTLQKCGGLGGGTG